MEQVQRYLHESDDKFTKLEKGRTDMVSKIQLQRTRGDIKNAEQQLGKDEYISCQCAQLDKASHKDLCDFGKRIEKQQIAQLKKALADQQSLFAQLIAKERAVAKEVLRQIREEHEENIRNEREKIDALDNQAKTLLVEWKNDRTKLKSLIENLILTQHQEVHGNINDEEPEEERVTLCYAAMDYDCSPDVVMKFFVHKVPELYSDMLKYDLRATEGEFRIASPATSVEYAYFIQGVYFQGYIRDAEVYYLDPTPRSTPSTGLIKIDGPEDVKQMVSAHAQVGTKICHVYLVSTYGNQPADMTNDDIEAYLPCESDEQSEEAETSNADVLMDD